MTAPDKFIRVDGLTELYDVVRDREIVGLVWRHGAIWHASAFSMANPAISEASREAAAARLQTK